MYTAEFIATTSADWAESIEMIDADTNLPLVLPDDAEFELAIGDRCWVGSFLATTENGKISRPEPHIITWRFTRDDLTRYWSRNTYRIGLTVTVDGGTTQLLTGTLSIIDGIVPWH